MEHHIELYTSLTIWNTERIPIIKNYNVRDFARLQLITAIYGAATDESDAEGNLNVPDGDLRIRVNQLMNALDFRKLYGGKLKNLKTFSDQ